MDDEPARWVRTADELEDFVEAIAGARAIAVDTEGDSLHHYADRVCLIQVAAIGRGAWLVDPMALRALGPLGTVMADARVVKVVHGGDNDVTAMRRDFGFEFRTLFDTAIAARLLGDSELGLQAIVRNELGVELSKGSQKDDWSRRPLTPKQEAYALADVAYLFELATRFTERLAEAGRTEWAREEFAALASLPAAVKRTGPDEFRRIKGSAALSRRQQAVLREIYAWREERAAEADRPPFKIVGPDVLLAIAQESPTTLDGVAHALRSYPRLVREHEVVLDAIEHALALPDAELPTRDATGSRARPAAPPPEARQRVEALRAWRTAEAERSRLDPAVVLSQRLIDRIAEAAPRTLDELAAVEGIRRWRISEWGTPLLAAATGRAVTA